MGPCYNRLGGEAAILPEADIAQQEIAQRVDAIGIGKCHRIDDIAGRFGHLLAAVEHEAMPEHLFGQRDPRRHKERRPVDRVEADDILADRTEEHTSELQSLIRISYAVSCVKKKKKK